MNTSDSQNAEPADISAGTLQVAGAFEFGTFPQGGSKTLQVLISNPSNRPLLWHADAGGTSWLMLDKIAGILQPGGQEAIYVTVDARSLAVGGYAATLTFTSEGDEQSISVQVPVSLTVDTQTKHSSESEFPVVDNAPLEERETPESASILRIRIIEEPLTANNFTTIISALTELHTKCWLIQQDRFSDLIHYTQTRDIRFTREANLVIGKLTYNSPALIDLLLNPATLAATATVALALKTAIDAIAQTPLRFQATRIKNQREALEQKIREQEANQAQQVAAQKAETENKAAQQDQQFAAQKAELERQKLQLELDKQRLELAQQQLELDRQRLELEKNRVEVALETASKMVDILRPGVDLETKGMLVQPLLPSLLQLGSTEGLELDSPASKPLDGVQQEKLRELIKGNGTTEDEGPHRLGGVIV